MGGVVDSRLVRDKTKPKEGTKCCYYCDLCRHWGATTGSCVKKHNNGRDVYLNRPACDSFRQMK